MGDLLHLQLTLFALHINLQNDFLSLYSALKEEIYTRLHLSAVNKSSVKAFYPLVCNFAGRGGIMCGPF